VLSQKLRDLLKNGLAIIIYLQPPMLAREFQQFNLSNMTDCLPMIFIFFIKKRRRMLEVQLIDPLASCHTQNHARNPAYLCYFRKLN